MREKVKKKEILKTGDIVDRNMDHVLCVCYV